MWRSVLLVILVISIKTKAMRSDSDEDTHSHSYLERNPFRPTTMNFDDIFAKSLTTLLLADQPSSSSTTEENFHLIIATQYIDSPKTQTSLLISSLIAQLTSPSPTSRKSRRSKTTTEEYIEETGTTGIAASTSTKQAHQRGVLDLLFPAARVKTFKSFFDGFRRILSHTF